MRGLVVTAVCVSAVCTCAAPSVAATPREPQETVVLLEPHIARSLPYLEAPQVARISPRRPLTAVRTTLPILSREVGADGRPWLRVLLPGRALGRRAPPRTGWIDGAATRVSATAWSVVVDRTRRRVLVRREGVVVRRYRAIVGAPRTPTPRGKFFVEENVRLGATRAGAPFALALSARSSVYQEFDGGPGQVAIHGRGNLGGRLGTAVSHGCIRLSDAAIGWMAARIPPGAPVTIL